MIRRTVLALAALWMLAAASPAFAEPDEMAVNIEAGPLPESLQSLVRQTGIELLFDPDLVRGQKAPAVRGSLTAEAALRQLMTGTDLRVRRSTSGAWVVESQAATLLEQPDAAVPEIIIVTARAVQNADIRRYENDVQPYIVTTRKELTSSHRDNVEQYFATRVTQNAQAAPSDISASGSSQASIDLRGLGIFDTLVLIDGRRMPTFPDLVGFYQSDINSVPLHAIDRIETLTGTAGGIYGFGALGGVVNIVLDRGTNGFDLHLTEGVTSRGDAQHEVVETAYGFRSEDGATNFSAFLSHSETGRIRVGDRDFAANDREEAASLLSPVDFVSTYRSGNSITLASFSGPLVFKPEFGGGQLGTAASYLPFGFSGDNAALAAALGQRAGQVDSSVPVDDLSGDLGSSPHTDSLLLNLHHRFDGGFDIYLDAIGLRSHAKTIGKGVTGQATMLASSPLNPFTSTITVYFPISGLHSARETRAETTRFTAGMAANLPFDWRGTLEASAGGFFRDSRLLSDSPRLGSFLFFSGSPSDPTANPLGDWGAFHAAVPGGVASVTRRTEFRTRFRDESLRLAGPVFSTPAGPSTLTLQGEHRSEYVPAYTEVQTVVASGTATSTPTSSIAWQNNETTSLYTELRSRVFEEEAPLAMLRGLELQLAIRRDDQEEDFATDIRNPNAARVSRSFGGTTFTAGAKATPTSWLMLRGSYSTGKVPPRLSALSNGAAAGVPANLIPDPKRPGDSFSAFSINFQGGANPNLTLISASTSFLGFVLTPIGEGGPRLAVDYSRIRQTDNIVVYAITDILAHEDFWPDRVTRALLTDADRANGYPVGRVTGVDARFRNEAIDELESVDVHADWPVSASGGRLNFYADATYHFRHVQSTPFKPDRDRAGALDAPVEWRANAGVDWSIGDLTIGANVQYLGNYHVTSPNLSDLTNNRFRALQGSNEVPSQTYVDLNATWRLPFELVGPGREATLQFGLINVFDEAPPRQIPGFSFISQGYSQYGDPRQRRFEMTLSSHF